MFEIYSQLFTVSPGDVLGWYPSSNSYGDIGFYAIDPVQDGLYREYQFDLTYETFIGAIFSRDIPMLSKANSYMHMVRAYVHSPSNILKTYQGKYII